MSSNLTRDTIVVVTGGGSGIGLCYVKLARAQGARAVIIADLRLTEEAERLVNTDGNIIFQHCDVTIWSHLQGVIDRALSTFGDVPDVFVASAGVFEPPYSNFWEDPEPLEANGYAQVDINVNHPIKLTRLAIRTLLGKQRRGIVVLVASIAGYSKQYPAPLYSATKHAVVGFTRSMGAAELHQGVRVVAVCPGIVSTPIWTTGTPGSGQRFGVTSDIAIGPDAVADVINEAVESAQYPGGTVLEISRLGKRVVPEWNIDPPGKIGGEMATGTDVPPDRVKEALQPILDITAAERGTVLCRLPEKSMNMADKVLSVSVDARHPVLVLALFPIVLGISYLALTAAYNVLFHPLRKYPGPILWASTRIFYTNMYLSGRGHVKILELHKRYGPVVRVAPDTLSYNHPDAWKEIRGHRKHGAGEHGKDPIFQNMNLGNIIGANREDHARFRRVISHGFSAQAMLEQQPIIKAHVDTLFRALKEQCAGGEKSLDIVAWYNYTTFDVIGDLAFGEPFGCLESSAYHPWVSMIFDGIKNMAFESSMRRYQTISGLLMWFMPREVRDKMAQHRELSRQKVQKRMALTTTRPDFIDSMMKKRGATQLSFDDIVANAATLIIAGSETTATLLSAATFFLTSHPETLMKLTNEVRSSFSCEKEIDLISVQKLVYMLAVLDETLRMYPPVPAGGPRKIAPGGDVILGQYVPGGTIAEIWHYAVYHNPLHFALPDDFIPERWLNDPRFETDKQDAFQPFSFGPRNCIGKNLAYSEMRLILARMVWNFDMKLASDSLGWDDKSDVHILWKKGPLHSPVARGKRVTWAFIFVLQTEPTTVPILHEGHIVAWVNDNKAGVKLVTDPRKLRLPQMAYQSLQLPHLDGRRNAMAPVIGAMPYCAMQKCHAERDEAINMREPMRYSTPLVALALPALVSANKKKPLVDSKKLQKLINIDGLIAGSQKLQDFADANGGNRAFGSSGHNATVDWLYDTLKATGYYDVVKQPFTEIYAQGTAALKVDGEDVAANIMTYTPAGTASGPLVKVANLGCDAEDYPAEAKGTSLSGTLGAAFGDYAPIVGISQEDGQAILTKLEAGDVTVDLDIDATVEDRVTFNVIAETKEGDHDNVLVLGGHSDSVPAGPGINDDGSGTVGVLKVAQALTKFRVKNAVRFAFWSAEEFGLLGSYHYIKSVNSSDTELAKIRAYLNFDMIASPNYVYGIYDGDGSAFNLTGPAGSDKEPFVPSEFSGRSDYAGFIENGIPSGGLFTGAEELKTEEEAKLFGGEAGVAYDVNYHLAGDDITNLNKEAFLLNTKAIANSVAKYALSFKSLPAVSKVSRRWDADAAQHLKRSSTHSHAHGGPCGAVSE
ncbi:hypothetical protein NM208_g587 [Fusarium decemcellulare]|uniref:Uncharacterized protein n=1 Tax=Fusarium decemcellulare TaxID=57161 RepID=A0ACC1SYU9_9HYPO|nr:hypothetical protein NM208_g587 [Fusarium decemcellulare]